MRRCRVSISTGEIPRWAAGFVAGGLVLLLVAGYSVAAPAPIPNWVEHLAIQVTRSPLDNVKLRQAIASAIDRAAVMRAAAEKIPSRFSMLGRAESWFVPDLSQHRGELRIHPYDPAKAKDLLAEAGFPCGSGLPALEILYRTDFPHRRAAAEVLQSQLLAVGIPAKAVALSSQEFGRRVLTLRPGGGGGDFALAVMAWGAPSPESDFLTMFLQGSKENVYGYRSTEATLFLTHALKEQDQAKKITLLQRAEEVVLGEVPVVPLYYYSTSPR